MLDCPPAGGQTYTISGHVYKPDGSPLSGVLVETWPYVCGWSQLTAGDGAYSFSLTAGEYQIYFNMENQPYLYGCYSSTSGTGFTPYCDLSTVVNLTSDMTIDGRMDAGYLISGTVTGVGDAPLAGIAVLATSSDYQWQVASGIDGGYSTRVPDGSYTLRFTDTTSPAAYATGYYSDSGFVTNQGSATPVVVSGSSVPDISVQMLKNATILGSVHGVGGTPLAGAQVHVHNATFDTYSAVNVDGVFAVPVPAGSYTVDLSYATTGYWTGSYSSPGIPGFAGFTPNPWDATPVVVGTADVPGIDINAPPIVNIRGSVENAAHDPLPDIYIYASSSGLDWGTSGWSGSDGTFAIQVIPGAYTLQFLDYFTNTYAQGYYGATGYQFSYLNASPITVTSAGDTTGITVQMPLNYHIKGTLSAPSGTPIAGVRVEATSTAGYSAMGDSAADGTYDLLAPSGSYVIGFNELTSTFISGWLGASGYTPFEASAAPVTVGTADSTGNDATLPYFVTTYQVTGVPSPVNTDTSTTFSVQAMNFGGGTAGAYSGTIHFTSSDPEAILPADYTFSVSDGGLQTFSITFKTEGTQWVRATSTLAAAITGSQEGIVVGEPVLIASFRVVTASSWIAGAGHTVTVTARDVLGHTLTNYTGTVHLSSTDPQAVLPADYTFTLADAGVHRFATSIRLKTAGTQSVTANDLAHPTVTGSQGGIVVSSAAFSAFRVSTATSWVAGVAHSVNVIATDAYGNTVRNYAGTVHFTSSDTQAVLPADYSFVSGDSGAHTFAAGVVLRTAGTQWVRATNVGSSATGVQSGIVVTAGRITVTVSTAATWVAGVAHSVTVTARDAYGNPYLGTLHLTSSDVQAVLPADYTFVSADAGVHRFSSGVVLKTAGTQSVIAKDTVNATITGSQTGIVVSPARLSTFRVSTATTWVAGVAHTLTATAQDAYGNTITGYTGTIHLTSSDLQATLPPDYAFTAGDAGTHRFASGVVLKTAGTQWVKVTDVATSVNASATGIAVSAASVASFRVTTVTTWVANSAHSVNVTAIDAYGNTVTGYTGTVHFTSSDPLAVLPADYTFTAGDAGVHAFSAAATLKTKGTQWIRATDLARPTLTGAQSGITVS